MSDSESLHAERKRFERWFREGYLDDPENPLRRGTDGEYKMTVARAAWKAWLERGLRGW